MNKELIKKYKAEFDHWLNGGELLSKHPDETNWYLVTVVLWNCPKMQYIINDEYVEFRQALAEGKTVEVAIDHNDIDGYIWKNIEDDEFHYFSIDEIRIKPEEPKFKVGDWVVNKASKQRIVKKVASTPYGDSVTVGDKEVGINVMLINDLELWQPKAGDWCWFWNSGTFPELRQFKRLLISNKYQSCQTFTYDYCEPFLGKLPTALKGM